MKEFLVYVGVFLIGISGVSLIVVGSLATVWLSELDDLFHTLSAFSMAISALTLGSIFVIYAGILVKAFTLRMSFAGWISAVIFMAILGTITIVFNEIFVSDALIIFKRIFEARFATYSGETLDRLQQGFECCGPDGYRDFGSIYLPASCCPENNVECQITTAFTVGCNHVFRLRITLISAIIAYASFGFAGFLTIILLPLGIVYLFYRKTSS